jgi:hypothetical protein
MVRRFLPTIHNLPTALNREIGRVVVSYARLEWLLSQILYAALGVSAAEGRIAVGEPRATDRFDRINDILRVNDLIPDPATIAKIREGIEACQTQRDQLAHSVWGKAPEDGRLLLCITKGSWQPVKGQKGKTSRKISPQGVEYNAEDARSLHALIVATIEALEHWNNDLVAQQALRKKDP